jgi:hypothetical protein
MKRKMSENSLANLKRSKKGDKPKPNCGRPKKLPEIRDALVELMADEKNGKTAFVAMLEKARADAIRGNKDARDFIVSYLYGKPKSSDTLDVTVKKIVVKTPDDKE